MYIKTTATEKILGLKKRIRCVQGGTSASKTISILMYLMDDAASDTTPTITSVVSESFPHLKRGVIRDFLSIVNQHVAYDDAQWNRTDHTFTFRNGSKIEFFSADQPSKVRGPRRDRLFINEANNIPYETFDQLEVRTKEYVFLDWNPTTEFWYYDKVANRTDAEHIIVTYKDNEGLDKSIVDSIEQRKGNTEWWKVYGLGQLGEIESRIYKGWEIIDEIPAEARLVRRGLDFGYTNDPAAVVDVYQLNDGYILDEKVYERGLFNSDLAKLMKDMPRCLTIADSAEPKSIAEISTYNLPILPSKKGKGSILHGIDAVQSKKISVTKNSTNLIKEYRNYTWLTDKDGKIINEPSPIWDHALDAARYAIASLIRTEEIDAYEQPAYEAPAGIRDTKVGSPIVTIGNKTRQQFLDEVHNASGSVDDTEYPQDRPYETPGSF